MFIAVAFLVCSNVLYQSCRSSVKYTLVALTVSMQCCRQCGGHGMLSGCGSGRLAVVATRSCSEGSLGAAGESGGRFVGTALWSSLSAIGRDGRCLGRSIWGRCDPHPSRPLGSHAREFWYKALGFVAALHVWTGKVDLLQTGGGGHGVGTFCPSNASSSPAATLRQREHIFVLGSLGLLVPAEWLRLSGYCRLR